MSEFVGPDDAPDRYELVELRSRGGEGALWRATIDVDGQAISVAVKIVEPATASELADYSERWRRQAELLRSLEHPNLVTVREAFEGAAPHARGETGDRRAVYLVMNWASGESLPSFVEQHPERDPLETSRIVTRIAGTVDYLHSGRSTGGVPVLHRDIKPANVVVDGPGVRLVDFGFARLVGEQFTFAGTPAYLAPEVVAGAPPTAASDRYGVGATSYYLFTGQDPTPNDVAGMRSRLLRVPGLEGREDIADHVLEMMSRDPARRPANNVDWAQSLAVGTVSERLPDRVAPAEVTPTSRPRGRRAVLAGVVVGVVIALAAAGIALVGGGGSDGDDTAATKPTASKPEIVKMPDVVGESLADARATLRKQGIRDVTVEQEESTESEGTVLDQDPPSGERVDGGVTLTVAEEITTLPDVVGTSLSEATNQLQALGVTVKTTDVLDETKTDGTVLAQDPVAGGPLVDEVTLQVARQSVSTFLSDIEPVQGSASTGNGTVSGQAYPHSVLTRVYPDQPDDIGYDLGRHYRRLKATVGLSDAAPANAQLKFEVLGDGRSLFNQTVGLGSGVPVDIDVTGVLRLTISVAWVNADSDSCCGGVDVVWGDIRVLGTPSEVPGYGTPADGSTTTTFG